MGNEIDLKLLEAELRKIVEDQRNLDAWKIILFSSLASSVPFDFLIPV